MREWRHRVTRPEAGGRLDRFLQESLPDLTRSQIKRLVTRKLVRVNGAPAKAGHPLRIGETLEVTIPPPAPITPAPESIAIDVVYEDDALLVVDKPAGMVVHPGAGRTDHTLVNALLGRGTALSPVGAPLRPGIVHRLDKGTSGLLVVAKTERAHRELSRRLAAREVERRYWALIWGSLGSERGKIDARLGRSRADRRRMRVVPGGGREAVTRYRVLWAGGGVTAVSLMLDTGRTHQIRAHFKHLGHPVFGDPDYGGRGRAGSARHEDRMRARSALGLLPRQALHAMVLGFRHPESGKRLVFVSPLPEDIRTAAAELEVPAHVLNPGVKEVQ